MEPGLCAGPLVERLLWAAALVLTLLFIGRTMAPAFGPGATVQDDARQHVFWMARFRDPELFQNDLIADYFQAVAPPGYAGLYWALSRVADPLLVSKLLPPILGLVVAYFAFLLVRRLHPSPFCAFVATVLVSWYAWQYPDIVSGTPRAFVLPLLVAQLWAMATDRRAVAAGLVVSVGLFYPSAALLGGVLLAMRLVRFHGRRPTFAGRADWLAVALAAALLVPLVWAQQQATAAYGPVVSSAEARRMKEFDEEGRSFFFNHKPFTFWVLDPRSGFDLAARDDFLHVPIFFEYLGLAALLPVLLLLRRPRAIRLISGRSTLLLHLLIASLGLFFLAHLLLFRLYLPSRYVKYSVPLVLAVAAGLAIGALIEATVARWRMGRSRLVAAGLAVGVGIALALYPSNPSMFMQDPRPAVTDFLRAQPKDILVAGASIDTDSVPTFAARRVLTSRELMIPYHLGFYRQLSRRAEDLVDAYYARSRSEVADFITRYGVDVLLVNRAAFNPLTALEPWTDDFEPFRSRILSKFRSSSRFWLRDAARTCGEVDDGSVLVVPTSCLLSRP